VDSPFQLSDLETDLLAELFNIGVGKAADSLSRMVNQAVKLSVPMVEIKSIELMAEYLGGDTEICSVSQEMRGSFDARSMLMFHEENSMEVVRQLMGSNLPDEMVAEMQEEALSEIGNIVLNACIGAIASSLEQEFEVDLPEFQQGKPLELLSPSNTSEDSSVLLIRIHMELTDCAVKGYLAFLLGPTSQENLHNSLKVMLAKFS
jgi:chemotaxis protein CheC